MKLDKEKIEIAMARKNINIYGVCEAAQMQYQMFRRIFNGNNCKPTTAGRIAAALGVDVAEISADNTDVSDDNIKPLSEYSTDELLAEIKRRCSYGG